MNRQFYLNVLKIFQTTMIDLQQIIQNHSIDNTIELQNNQKDSNAPKPIAMQVEQSEESSRISQKNKKTKKIKKKKKQIPGMPKPPANSFVLYLQDTKHKIQKQNPGISIAAVTSIASKVWKQAPQAQKKHYRDMHQANRQVYLVKKQQFLQKNPQLAPTQQNLTKKQQQSLKYEQNMPKNIKKQQAQQNASIKHKKQEKSQKIIDLIDSVSQKQ